MKQLFVRDGEVADVLLLLRQHGYMSRDTGGGSIDVCAQSTAPDVSATPDVLTPADRLIAAGDIVRLKTGGMPLVVQRIIIDPHSERSALVAYFDDDGILRTVVVACSALERVQ